MLYWIGYISNYGEADRNGLKIHSVTSSYLVSATSMKYLVLDLEHNDHYNAVEVQVLGRRVRYLSRLVLLF